MKEIAIIIILFLGGLFFVNNASAQENAPEPRNRIFEKKEKERAKERKQAEKEINKAHANIQDKATLKRIKKNKKRADRLRKKKMAEPFWKKWFRK